MSGNAHAIHNETLCDHLATDGRFNDWVVTTAFYSALHYFQSELFPLIAESVTYPTFNEYHIKYIGRKKKLNISKHEAILRVVRKELSSAYSNYKWLYDSCMTARYKQYLVSPKKAQTAKSHLDTIKVKIYGTVTSTGAVL